MNKKPRKLFSIVLGFFLGMVFMSGVWAVINYFN